MSTTKRGSDKIAAPPCYAGEPMVEERFFPRLGRSIKVYPADFGSFTKNEEVLKNQRITPRHQSSSSPSFMSTMKPGSDLGEKKAAPPCYAGEPVVEERFFPRLGRSIKVYPADFGSFTKNEEYRDGSPRVLYESGAIGWVNPNKSVQSRSHHMESRKKMGFCGANPRKSVISRSSHIQNTKKVSVGRLRSGCKVHYLRRRLASPSVPNKFLFSPSSHALEICFPHEPVLSNSATPQTITAPSPFPFKLIDSPANLSPPCVSTEPRFKFTEWREASPFPGRTFKIRKLYDTQNMGNMTVVKSGGNLTSLPPRGILYERSCIEAKTKKSEGLDDDDDGSPRVLYESGCIGWANPNKSVQSRSHHMESSKKISVGRNLGHCKINFLTKWRQRLATHENRKKLDPTPNKPAKFFVTPPCVPTEEPRFEFTEWREALLFPGRTIKIRKLYDTQNLGRKKEKLAPNDGILYETTCIEAKAKRKSEGLDDEQKKMLFHATLILLENNGFTKSARALLREASIDKNESGAEPPDIERIFLSFLNKDESDALEKQQLKQLASSREMVNSSISYGSSGPEDDSIFSKYTSKASEEEWRLASSTVEYFCDDYSIQMAGLHRLTESRDIKRFFRKASINVESVEFHGETPDFNEVMRKSATIRFRRVEDTRKADSMNGSWLEIKKGKTKRGSHVFMSRLANEYRVLCITAFDGDMQDKQFLQKEANRLFSNNTAIQFVDATKPGHDVLYVVVKATPAFQEFLVDRRGDLVSLNDVLVREASLTANTFGILFPDLLQ